MTFFYFGKTTLLMIVFLIKSMLRHWLLLLFEPKLFFKHVFMSHRLVRITLSDGKKTFSKYLSKPSNLTSKEDASRFWNSFLKKQNANIITYLSKLIDILMFRDDTHGSWKFHNSATKRTLLNTSQHSFTNSIIVINSRNDNYCKLTLPFRFKH